VADRSTAGLTGHFYRNLTAGLTADDALRAAQIELASKPLNIDKNEMADFTYSYFWAAFQLSGDWK